MAAKIKIKKDDNVQIISGKDAGKHGKVLRVLPESNRVVVEKLNMIKRHTKPRPAPSRSGTQVIPGGVIEREAPLNVSNVQLICPSCGKPSRVGARLNKDGEKVRFCRNCDKDID